MTAVRAPVVGITARRAPALPGARGSRRRDQWSVDARLVDALVEAGAVPLVVPVPPMAAAEALVEALALRLDGLLLQGGGDVAPMRWGEAVQHLDWAGDPARDAIEFALFARMRARERPVLGICRGMQLANVALGGTLWQDLAGSGHDPSLHDDADAYDMHRHPVRLADRGWLQGWYGDGPARVSSAHHQAVARLAPGIEVEAWAPDGVVEALRTVAGGWLLGVQWHPEFHLGGAGVADDDCLPGHLLLRAFVDAART
ncbi:MAG: gamma-glutamyl-gamma-aminobutyrate hydrolase family protein [Xanthomonadaceae bacterium]|jgi:gamma-glutamyl-gamma-aminobutyrate hydrolase PuuD|nr:gamma-glutamyl-gamma-aminobutyrate hydrolase family protein [Xanthomonadaceae bacterium]